jgi:putative salt-induced outer membrane protein
MRYFLVAALSLSVVAGLAGISSADPWTDQAELSFVDTGGNTETTSLSAKNILKGPLSGKLALTWSLSALLAETDDVITAEQYITEARLDYSISERFYGFGLVNLKQDEPAGLDSRTSIGLGAGYKFLTGPVHELAGEAGLNQVAEEFTDGTDNDYTSGRMFAGYAWNLSESSKFTQTVEYLADLDDSGNYQTNTETAYISTVSEVLSLKTSFDTQYDNDPPAGFKKTDTKLGVTLVFNLK